LAALTGGGGDGLDVLVRDAGLDQGLGDHGREQLDVGAAGDLGDDAAVAGVAVDLAGHHRRADAGGALDHRGGGLVT
jgi:hypothetical protein